MAWESVRYFLSCDDYTMGIYTLTRTHVAYSLQLNLHVL